MDKKTGIIIGVLGAIVLVLVLVVFGLETKSAGLTSSDVLRINNEIYSRSEFEDFLRYTLYKNDGEIKIDEEDEDTAHALENGTSKEEIFKSNTLNSFYQMKVCELVANDKNIVVEAEKLEEISGDFEKNKEKLEKFGLGKESFVNIEKGQAVVQMISNEPSKYLTLPDGVYDEYLKQFSGDDLKSYTYRMIQVSYTADKVSGETSGESGEVVPGNRAEKEAYMNAIVARIKSGVSFEEAAESGDNRLIFVGNGIQFAKSIEENAAGFLLEQKLNNEDAIKAVKNAKDGEMTDVIDTGDAFEIYLVEKVQDGIVGKAKDELIELMISSYANDLIYQYVKDMEVNNAALARIKIR